MTTQASSQEKMTFEDWCRNDEAYMITLLYIMLDRLDLDEKRDHDLVHDIYTTVLEKRNNPNTRLSRDGWRRVMTFEVNRTAPDLARKTREKRENSPFIAVADVEHVLMGTPVRDPEPAKVFESLGGETDQKLVRETASVILMHFHELVRETEYYGDAKSTMFVRLLMEKLGISERMAQLRLQLMRAEYRRLRSRGDPQR